MSAEPRRRKPITDPAAVRPETDELAGPAACGSWPATGRAAFGLTGLLALALTGPALARGLGLHLWPALLLPGLIATLAARLVFESVDGTVLGRRRLWMHLPGAAAGAAAGALLMALARPILGLGFDVNGDLLAVALALTVLTAVGFVRDVEVRLHRASRRVYFAGTADGLRGLQRELRRSPEARLVGSVAVHAPIAAEQLAATVRESRATVLVLDRSAAETGSIITAATALAKSGVRVRDLLGYYESEFQKVPLTELTPAWFLFEHPAQQRLALWARTRRATVVITAAVLLIVSLPLLCLLVLAIRVTSPGPAIFRQLRVGKDGALFTLFKLRTMTLADDSPVWATDQEHRITTLGRVLRRYRLDELPQLWNVVRGELALVGPRPEQVAIVERLVAQIPFYEARHTVRPGLTGWAQVNLGYAGSLQGARAKLQRDLYYVKHRSVRLDLLIVWLTLKAVFTDPH